MTAARVLFVCTANQCRSPMAELLFQQALQHHERTPAWDVSSAGTFAPDGRPMHPLARSVLEDRGIVVNGFKSRQLTPEIIADSDLILTAERTHRAEVVAVIPEALHRTFTLRQFARLVEVGSSAPRDTPSGDDLAALVDMARRARSRSEPGDDDLADPIGRRVGRRRHFKATADRVESAVATIFEVLAARKRRRRSYTAFGDEPADDLRSPVQIQDYLRALRRGWRIIVVSVIACLLVGGLIIARSERVYAANAELFVAPGSGSSTAELVQGSAFFEDRVKTYALIVDSAVVLEPVIEELGLDESARSLAASVSATAPIETVLLRIRVTDTDPERAAAVANAVAARFRDVATELETVEGSDEDPVVRVTIVEPATVPRVPISPNTKLILVLAAMIGLAVGFAIAVSREALNNRVRSESDLRAITDIPVVGKIPQKERDARLLLVDDAAHGFRAEAFRQLRTNLQYLDISGEHHTFVITSALPGEGKSVTATNLALTIASTGLSVCLVEADLRRPRISRLLDLESEVGLTSIIIGSVTADQAAQQWGDTGVHVIAAGHLPPNPSELLNSNAMSDLVEHLKNTYDFVILDAPPLLAVTDAAILARRCGGAIVVVANHGRRTVTREQLLEAFENLETAGTKVLGVVLNRLPTKGPDAIALSEYGYVPRPNQAPPPRPAGVEPPVELVQPSASAHQRFRSRSGKH